MGITFQKMAGAILFALILVVALNLLVNGLMPKEESHPSPAVAAAEGGYKAKPEAKTGAGTPSGEQAAPPAAAEKPFPERLAAANVEKGQTIAKKCQSCHTFNEGGPIKVGPNLYGVIGRPKASFPGFAYSDALKKLGGNWTYEDLDQFLTKPGAFAPGTKMSFPGLPDGQERADVIAYLRTISPNAPAPPK